MGINATITDFFKTESLDLLNSSSKDPSRTITIKPIVPKIGSSPLRLGTLILKTSVNCCNPYPERSKRITDGIFVLDVVKSNMYAIIMSTQNAIINVFVIALFYMLSNIVLHYRR